GRRPSSRPWTVERTRRRVRTHPDSAWVRKRLRWIHVQAGHVPARTSDAYLFLSLGRTLRARKSALLPALHNDARPVNRVSVSENYTVGRPLGCGRPEALIGRAQARSPASHWQPTACGEHLSLFTRRRPQAAASPRVQATPAANAEPANIAPSHAASSADSF